METFRIKIIKPGKKGPHYSIVTAPSLQSAEHYALEHMLFSSAKIDGDDHGKMGVTPDVTSVVRSDGKSLFEFKSPLINGGLPATIRIVRDNDANPSVRYNIDHDESIFETWRNNDFDDPDQLPFFTENDLAYFSSVVGVQFSQGDPMAEEIQKALTENGVFAKTHYWASRLQALNYKTEFRYDWQHSGRVRSYTWARVSPPQSQSPYVFFTIGVGSRLAEGNVSALEYKLDCRRDQLSAAETEQFDGYMDQLCPDAKRQIIKSNELAELNWESLTKRTCDFIDRYKYEYKFLTDIIRPAKHLPKRIARLCWNENGWEAPSGPWGKSKTTAKSFEKEKGYGHEEWLFDVEKQIDGYQYGFMQAFNKGDHEGEVYNITLYAIKDTGKSKEKYWVAHINELEVLTNEEREKIVSFYKEKGWLTQRLAQLKEFNILNFNFDIVEENQMFNIRYKVETTNWTRFNPYQLVRNFDAEVGSNHYVLLERQAPSIVKTTSGQFNFEEGYNPDTKMGSVVSKYTRGSYTKTLLHSEIQKVIYDQLKKEYQGTAVRIGTEQSTGLGTFIDLVVSHPLNGYTFYEIKTGGNALTCIREAIGQIFEYCYYPSYSHASKMIIVAPHQADFNIKLYMRHLRRKLGLEIFYQYYSLSEKNLDMTLH